MVLIRQRLDAHVRQRVRQIAGAFSEVGSLFSPIATSTGASVRQRSLGSARPSCVPAQIRPS
jgi:hypothetical protein